MQSECNDLDGALAFTFFEHDDGPYFDMDLSFPGFSNRGDDEDKHAASESQEFEFSISISAAATGAEMQQMENVSPADELFYKGQLLPLHLPPRLQMVRNLSLPREEEKEEVADENNGDNCNNGIAATPSDCCVLKDTVLVSSSGDSIPGSPGSNRTRREKAHFPFLRKSARNLIKVSLFGFRKSSKVGTDERSDGSPKRQRLTVKAPSVPKDSSGRKSGGSGSRKRSGHWFFSTSNGRASAKEVVQRYFRLAKPPSGKVSQKPRADEEGAIDSPRERRRRGLHSSIPGDLKTMCRQFGVESCPPSMNSSPSHSGVLNNFYYADSSTMLDLHNSIQGAIAHCKKSNGILDARNSEVPC